MFLRAVPSPLHGTSARISAAITEQLTVNSSKVRLQICLVTALNLVIQGTMKSKHAAAMRGQNRADQSQNQPARCPSDPVSKCFHQHVQEATWTRSKLGSRIQKHWKMRGIRQRCARSGRSSFPQHTMKGEATPRTRISTMMLFSSIHIRPHKSTTFVGRCPQTSNAISACSRNLHGRFPEVITAQHLRHQLWMPETPTIEGTCS